MTTDAEKAKEDANKALSLDASCAIGVVTEHEWFSASRPLLHNLARHCLSLPQELAAFRATIGETAKSLDCSRAEVLRLGKELDASRAATNKTAIERDRYHDELIQAQAQVLRVALAIEDPDIVERIRQIAADAECSPVKCHRVADGVVGLLRVALNPKVKM